MGSKGGFAARQDGSVFAWGTDENGSLGQGEEATYSRLPVKEPKVGVDGCGICTCALATCAACTQPAESVSRAWVSLVHGWFHAWEQGRPAQSKACPEGRQRVEVCVTCAWRASWSVLSCYMWVRSGWHCCLVVCQWLLVGSTAWQSQRTVSCTVGGGVARTTRTRGLRAMQEQV